MGVLGDTAEEFKKAKTPEKVLIIGGSIAVLGIALYLRSKSSQSQGATGTGGPAAPTSGWGTVGPNQTPIEPGGYCPDFDPNGNLIGFKPCGTAPAPTPTPTPTPKPKPAPPPKKDDKETKAQQAWENAHHREFGTKPPAPRPKPKPAPRPHTTHVATTASRQVHR